MEQLRIRLLMIAFGIAYLGCVDYLPKYGIAVYPFGYAADPRLRRSWSATPSAVTTSCRSRRRWPRTEIIGTMADVLFVCDREGRIEFANRAADHLLGYSEASSTGKSIDELLAQEGDLSANLQRRSLRNDEHVFATAHRRARRSDALHRAGHPATATPPAR